MIVDHTILKNYTFVGKHARFVNDLVGDRYNSFFKSNISLFLTAAMVGIAQNLKSFREKKDSSIKPTKIEGDALVLAQPKIWLALQLAVMNDRDSTLEVDARLKHLYESQSVPEEYKDLLEEYMLGGLEYLHEHLWAAGCSATEKIGRMSIFIENLPASSLEIKALDIVNKADAVMTS